MCPTNMLAPEFQHVVQRGLIEMGKRAGPPRQAPAPRDAAARADWKRAENVVIVVQRQADLFHVVFTTGTACRLTSLLHGRQQQCNQNGDGSVRFISENISMLTLSYLASRDDAQIVGEF